MNFKQLILEVWHVCINNIFNESPWYELAYVYLFKKINLKS